MNSKFLLILIIAVFVSFAGGFFLANSLNRNELNALKAEIDATKTVQNQQRTSDDSANLSTDEIRSKISEADQNPADIDFQTKLGTALYQYAVMKQDAELLGEATRLLNRAYEANKKDFSIIVMLGNAYFDIAYLKKENNKFEKARVFYKQALEIKPNDADVITDYGLTYFLQTPPESEKALTEFQKSLRENPKHEKTLQALTQFYLSQKNAVEAEKYLSRLREVNANNPMLFELEKKVEDAKNNR